MSFYLPERVQVLSEKTYGDLETAAIAAGVDRDEALTVVDAILGPLRLAPANEDWSLDNDGCPIAYWSYTGEWVNCAVDPDDGHDYHQSSVPEAQWHTSDARAVDMRKVP